MPRLRHFYGPNHLHYVTTSIPQAGSRRLFDSERFRRKFVTTLADLRGELGFRIVGYVLIRQLTDCHLLLWPSDGANPTQIMQPACSAGPAVRPCGSSSDAGSCRAANRTIRFRLGPAPNTVSEDIQAAPSKPRRGGKAARLESEPCATFFQRLGFLPRRGAIVRTGHRRCACLK